MAAIKRIKGANMDIDFSVVEGMSWKPGKCPWGIEHKCAVKNISICKYFEGIEKLDTVLCSYKKD